MSEDLLQDKYHVPHRQLLQALYEAHAGFSKERQVACGPQCSVCCTDRLNLTSLEARVLAEALKEAGRGDLIQKAIQQGCDPQAAAATTFNQLAEMCIAQQEPPPDIEPKAEAQACALLEDGLCAAYEARPFACRAMVSKKRCEPGGQAVGEGWWFTLDTAFFQLIEHLDYGGGFGLLPRVMAAVEGEPSQDLLTCRFLPGLPAPEKYQERLQQTLGPVFAEPVEGRPLGLWFNLIREKSALEG